MVRARTSRIVVSQRDVRQTTQPEPPQQGAVSHLRSTIFCTWCRDNGRHFACLVESPHVACEDSESDCAVPSHDWTNSVMSGEGWVPTSGPCCEDCLEAAFERRKTSEGGPQGGDLVEGTRTWCRERGRCVRHSLQRGWNVFRGWLEQARVRWGAPSDDGCEVCVTLTCAWGS